MYKTIFTMYKHINDKITQLYLKYPFFIIKIVRWDYEIRVLGRLDIKGGFEIWVDG